MDRTDRESAFVGREAELAALRGDARRALRDGATAVLVAGEAGVGKSRLVREYAAGSPMLRTVAGGCPELGVDGLPFAPFATALRRLVREGAVETGPRPGELARLLPELGPVPEPSGEGRARLFEEVLVLLEKAAGAGGLTLVLEDLHWSDASTRDLLVFLLGNLDAARVQLIATVRTDDLHRTHPLRRLLPELERLDPVTRLDLAPLSRDEVADQAAALRGGALSAGDVDLVYQRSGGNPLFVESFLDQSDLAGAPVPAGPREMLLGALRPLDRTALSVLKAASLTGDRVDHALLEAVCELPADRFDAAVRAAVDANALHPLAEGYRFRHALLAEAVQEDLLPGERIRLHLRYADALAAGVPGIDDGRAAAMLAHHAYAAHDLPRALESAWRAAEAARRAAAAPERLALLDRVLELWERVPDAAERIGRSHAEVLCAASETAKALDNPRRAHDYADTGLRTHARWLDTGMCPVRASREIPEQDAVAMGMLLYARGQAAREMSRDGALEDFGEALTVLPDRHPLRPAVTAAMAATLSVRGHDEEAERTAAAALLRAREAGDVHTEADALITLGGARSNRAGGEPALDPLRQGTELARRSGDMPTELRGMNNTAAVLNDAGRIAEGLRLNRAALERAAELGVSRTRGGGFLNGLAIGLLNSGKVGEAATLLRSAPPAANPRTQGRRHDLLAQIEQVRGSVSGTARELDAVHRCYPDEAVAEIEFVGVRLLQAWVDAEQGRPARAVEGVTALMERERPWLRGFRLAMWLFDAAEVWRLLDESGRGGGGPDGTVDRLREVLRERAVPLGDGAGMGVFGRISLGLALGVLGGRTEEDDALRRRTIGWLRSSELRLWLPAALLCRARNLLPGAREEAEPLVLEAHALAAEMGAGRYLRDAVRLMEEHGIALPAPAGPEGAAEPGAPEAAEPGRDGRAAGPLAALTPRELEVLRLVAHGRTNREIAAELVISVKTVSVHVSNVLAKLGVSNRNAAALKARDSGLE
ncbi:helix-turn-helix transcriptional regulator [Nocardiopsis potens]|uniref:helix-turn-helix transcriptional regulator n=1 Tax=Nocardiopsis potens TaxID=1246458 RepID=UPI00034A614E|nr:AAA family ATPase [Nocardiopsis potens]